MPHISHAASDSHERSKVGEEHMPPFLHWPIIAPPGRLAWWRPVLGRALLLAFFLYYYYYFFFSKKGFRDKG